MISYIRSILLCLLLSIAVSGEPLDWKLVNPGPTNAALNSIVWTGDKLVAVGQNEILTSIDGSAWTKYQISDPAGDAVMLTQVIFSGTLLLVVGNVPGVAWVSQDGNRWNRTTLGFPIVVSKLIWTGKEFVGFARLLNGSHQSDVFIISKDGLNWRNIPISAEGTSFRDIVWTGKRYVAVGTRTTPINAKMAEVNFFAQSQVLPAKLDVPIAAYSDDGESWTIVELPHETPPYDSPIQVVWTGRQLIAVGMNGGICTSSDGDSWDLKNPAHEKVGVACAVWTGSELVAVGTDSSRHQGPPQAAFYTSPGAIAWNRRNPALTGFAPLRSIVWTGAQFVAVGQAGMIETSPDGSEWTLRSPLGATKSLSKIATNGSLLVAVGDGVVLTSTDSSKWTTQSTPADFKVKSVAWIGSGFVAVGGNGRIFTSPDAKTWTSQESGIKHPLYDVAWTGAIAVAVGGYQSYGADSTMVLTSSDGKEWHRESLPEELLDLHSVTWTGSQLVAVGDNGSVARSPDGHHWTKVHGKAYDPMLYSVAWSGKTYVAVGVAGVSGKKAGLVSTDGEIWNEANIPTIVNLRAVAWCGDQFIAVGERGIVCASSDGVNWESMYSAQDMRSILWTGTRIVSVGEYGVVSVSEPTPQVKP
jgi:hypothetical protein